MSYNKEHIKCVTCKHDVEQDKVDFCRKNGYPVKYCVMCAKENTAKWHKISNNEL